MPLSGQIVQCEHIYIETGIYLKTDTPSLVVKVKVAETHVVTGG